MNIFVCLHVLVFANKPSKIKSRKAFFTLQNINSLVDSGQRIHRQSCNFIQWPIIDIERMFTIRFREQDDWGNLLRLTGFQYPFCNTITYNLCNYFMFYLVQQTSLSTYWLTDFPELHLEHSQISCRHCLLYRQYGYFVDNCDKIALTGLPSSRCPK